MSSEPKANAGSSGGPSLKTRLQLAANSLISYMSYRQDGTVNRRLLNLTNLTTPPSAVPHGGATTSDHRVPSSPHLWFRLFVPAGAPSLPKLPVIVYFHGGGFVKFSPATKPFDLFCRRLAAASPAVVVSVAYRLAPEHKLPSQYDDAFDALRFLGEHSRTIENFPENADLGSCFLAGDSAGGNIAHHVALRACGSDLGLKIRGVLSIQPFFGGEERTASEVAAAGGSNLDRNDFYWKAVLPAGSSRDHWAANPFGPGSRDVSGLDFPATLLVIGGLDALRDWQRKYSEGLRKSGKEVEVVEYPDAGHGFLLH